MELKRGPVNRPEGRRFLPRPRGPDGRNPARRLPGMNPTHPSPRELALTDEVKSRRHAGHPIASLLLNRWSPRAMTGEPLPEAELMALFEARHLHKRFGRQEVLKGLNLEIKPGEIFVIMGPSGSGKSVLLRHIIGLEPADSGEGAR